MAKKDLLDSLSPKKTEPPKQSNQVLFLNGRAVSGGGKASGSNGFRPGGRFNRPTQEEVEAHRDFAEELKYHVDNDPVVQKAKGKNSLELLSALKVQVANNAAILDFYRTQCEMMGQNPVSNVVRRVDALKKIADIELEIKKLGVEEIDVYGEKMQKVFKLWVDMIRSVAEEVLPPDYLDLFFNSLQNAMDKWEEKIESIIR